MHRERPAAAKVVNAATASGHDAGNGQTGSAGGSLGLVGGKKMASDATRYSADELVQELLNTVLDEGATEEGEHSGGGLFADSPFNGSGGLELFVAKDGSATIRSRQSRPGVVGTADAVKVAATGNGKARKITR